MDTMLSIAKVIWQLANTPAGMLVVATVIGMLAKWVYSKKPGWEQYEGAIISGVKYAEKNNLGGDKAKTALDFIIGVYDARGQALKPAQLDMIKDAIPVKHDELVAKGTLGESKPAAVTPERYAERSYL